MSNFDTLVAKFTEKGHAKVHGALFKCVDRHGNEVYSKVAGYNSLAADASPLREDAVFKVASCTKLITTIALLQCMEKGLLDLDEPVTKILPELDGREIVRAGPGGEIISEAPKSNITTRQLLTHTSGLGYLGMHPWMASWSPPGGAKLKPDSQLAVERYNLPLLFEPGTSWMYGAGLDWVGVIVRRLHGGISLEDYFNENVWKKVGLTGPFPTFSISEHPEYKARLMQAAARTSDGGLEPCDFPYGDNSEDQLGGDGLILSARDYLAVLADLVSDSPKLLKAGTISMMFSPQFATGSPALSSLHQLRAIWELPSSSVPDTAINHGLGSLLIVDEAAEIGQPENTLVWAGATGPVWFACKDAGVAGFFATQLSFYPDPAVIELINGWKKDFWSNFKNAG